MISHKLHLSLLHDSAADGLIDEAESWPLRLIDGENFKRDPNASIPTPQPARYRPMFGAFGGARFATSMTFASRGGRRRRGPAPAIEAYDRRGLRLPKLKQA